MVIGNVISVMVIAVFIVTSTKEITYVLFPISYFGARISNETQVCF